MNWLVLYLLLSVFWAGFLLPERIQAEAHSSATEEASPFPQRSTSQEAFQQDDTVQSDSIFGAPGWLEDFAPDLILHVDNQSSRSVDENSRRLDLPYNTLSAATEQAIQNRKRGLSTKIVIHDGLYREQIAMRVEPQPSDPPIIFEANNHGQVIISGSDIWKDWTLISSTNNLYAHSWPYQWGFAPIPEGWDGHVTVTPIVRRREMVVVNGQLLTQVLSLDHVQAGTFFISEQQSLIFMVPPSGMTMEKALVEVAIRSPLFEVVGKMNIVVRGLRFQHAASWIQEAAFAMHKTANIIIEDCRFLSNGWDGIGLSDVRNVTTRRNLSAYNGGTGWTGGTIKSLLSEDDETSYNNWRGAQGEFLYWAVAGTKYLEVHDAIIRRQVARGNHTAGFWLDTDNTNILLEENRWCGNLKHGLFIEASQGPIILRNSSIDHNQEWGIRAAESGHITLQGNIIYQNDGYQITIADFPERRERNWESGALLRLVARNWTLTDNRMSGEIALIDSPQTSTFLKSLVSDHNQWHTRAASSAFKIGEHYLPFSEWKKTTGQDARSTFSSSTIRGMDLPDNCSYHPSRMNQAVPINGP